MYFSHLMLYDCLALRSIEEREQELETLINMGFGNSVAFSPSESRGWPVYQDDLSKNKRSP
jgi:hypothetical protein